MNKDKRNNIQLLGTLNNADESGIIVNANQVYDANEDKSTQDVSKEHKERIETLETKESSMQTTLENITKTGEASAASNVTYNHSDSKLDATNVQQAIDEIRKIGDVFDISAYHATGGTLATYDNLEDALGTNGKNIPQSLRKGGMSVKFVQTSDNKYVQYRLMSTAWSANVSNWQGVDDTLIKDSKNLVTGKGIYEAIDNVYSQDNLLNASTRYPTQGNNKATSANSAVIGEAYNLAQTGATYYNYYKIPVKPGQEYIINITAASSAAYPVVFLNSNLIVLEIPTFDRAVQGNVYLNSKKLTAPANSAWMVVHTYSDFNTTYGNKVYLIGKTNNEINSINEKFDSLYIDAKSFKSYDNAYVLNKDGSVIAFGDRRIYKKEVKPGDIYKIKNLLPYYNNVPNVVNYALFNNSISTANLILAGPLAGGICNVEFVIPEGANLLAISCATANYDFLTLEKRFSAIENEERVKSLESKVPGIDNTPIGGSKNIVNSGGIYQSQVTEVDKTSLKGKATTNSLIAENGGEVPISTSCQVYRLYPVKEGEIYKITTNVPSTNQRKRVYGFYSSYNIGSSTFVGGSDAITGAFSGTLYVTIPAGVSCIGVSYDSYQSAPFSIVLQETLTQHLLRHDSEIEDIENRIKIEDNISSRPTINEKGRYILEDGSLGTSSNSGSLKLFAVTPGEKYRVRVTCVAYGVSGKYRPYGFYSGTPIGSSTFVSGYAAFRGNVTTEEDIVIPEGVAYIGISIIPGVTDWYLVRKYDINSIVNNNTGNIVELQNNVENLEYFDNNVKARKKYYDNSPIGVNDNFFKYVLKGIKWKSYVSNTTKRYGTAYKDANGKYTFFNCGSVGSGTTLMITAVFCIKKQTGKYFILANQGGGYTAYKFEDVKRGDILWKRNGDGNISTVNRFAVCLYEDNEVIQIQTIGNSNYRLTLCVKDTWRYSESDLSEILPFEVEEDYCGLFYNNNLPFIPTGDNLFVISPMLCYKSRAEKLGSNLFGKNAICFGDSLSPYMLYLLQDWGLNIYSFDKGGARMGYPTDTIDNWLCKDSFIQNFKNDTDKPEQFNFIINMATTNDGSLPDVTDTELQFVYNNKNWYDRSLEADPFDELSSSDKQRFTATACYLVSFYSFAQLYPKVQAVIVNPYFNRTGTNGFSSGKWASIDVFSTKLVAYTPNSKTVALKNMADMLDAIYVPNEVAVGFLNAPSCFPDGVHTGSRGAMSKAWTIAQHINFPADYDNSIV